MDVVCIGPQTSVCIDSKSVEARVDVHFANDFFMVIINYATFTQRKL